MIHHRSILLALALILLFCSPLLAVSPGDRLVPFTARDMEGNDVDLAAIIGKKPVMLVFWASWCPNCFREVPKVNALFKRFGGQGMAFLGINVGYNDSEDKARMFMKNSKMEYPVIFDGKHVITGQYAVRGVPTIVLADRQGKVVRVDFTVPEISDALYSELSR